MNVFPIGVLAMVMCGLVLSSFTGASAQTQTDYFYDENNRLITVVRTQDPAVILGDAPIDLSSPTVSVTSGDVYTNTYPFSISLSFVVGTDLTVFVDGQQINLSAIGSQMSVVLRPGQTIRFSFSGGAPVITWAVADDKSIIAALIAVYSLLLN